MLTQLKQDKMTERDRWNALMKGKPIDRIPFFLYGLQFSAHNAGYSISSVYEDSEKSFWSQVWASEMYGAYSVFYPGGAFPAKSFGGEVNKPDSEYSMAVSLLKPAVELEEDVWKLKVPDVEKSGDMPLIWGFHKLEAKYDFPITISIGGTLTRVGYICGVENLCRWMIKRPELIHRLCRIETDFVITVAKYAVELFDPEKILAWDASPTESNQILSPKKFEEFAFPYQQELLEKVKSMGIRHFFFHICGEQNLNLPYWAQLCIGDPSIISIGHEIDIMTAAKYFPKHIILGNINPAIIQNGTPNEVYEEARKCIEKGKKCTNGFILSPGCDLPVMAPPYNVWMIRKAINDFGWYE